MINYKIGKTINNKFFYGWLIIVLGAISYFFSAPGQTYFISTFIKTYTKEFNYSSTDISVYYSIATICSGSLLVFMGRQVDKRGQRTMLIFAGTMLAIASLFSSFVSNITLIFLSFFLLRYFGQGSLTLIPGSLVPQWFDKRKALAISLMSMGGLLASMIIPTINVSLNNLIGWRQTWRVWSLLLLVVFIPLMYVFVINKPEDIGLKPDNENTKSKEELEKDYQIITKESWTLNEAIKTKEFWIISIISMIVPMVSTGITFHFFSLMETKGVYESSAKFILGLAAIPGFIMPIISGVLIDRVKPKLIIFGTLSMITINLIFLLLVNSIFTASIFMLSYGLTNYIQNTTITVAYVTYFGRRYLGSIRVIATVFMVIGSALGPIPFGLSYDKTDSFNYAVISMMILSIIGIILSLSISKPEKKDL